MRKTTTLSTLVIAALFAATFIQPLVAQQFRPQRTNQRLQEPPRFLPPTQPVKPIQKVGYQEEEEVAVPSILGGQTAPAAKPAEGQQAKKLPKMPAQQPAQQHQTNQATNAPRTAQLPPNAAPMRRLPAAIQNANGSKLPTKPAAQPAALKPTPSSIPKMTAKAATERTPSAAGLRSNTLGNSPNWLRKSRAPVAQPAATAAPQQLQEEKVATKPQITTPLVSSTTTTTQPAPMGLITTAGPKLRVISNGPSSISIGKTASFEVIVENLEARSAESVIVGIDIPEWVELSNSNASTGTKEITGDDDGESRVVWQIPIVEAASSEKFVINVIPREARPFDMDVEWTFKPIRGKTTVEVTQPKLNIQIAGPTEVQFGEKALYNVTVSNPGTGTAENVSVMLPDALGGEQASLDSIAPQQQKKFQVELIARSAGTLDLTTTVVADGDLKQSDTREIIVRRGVLNVALKGPAMKYAGSVSTYELTVSNEGDAMAREVIAAVALPEGVEYVSGIDNVEQIAGGIRWNVGMLSPGNKRIYKINCDMKTAGDINIEAASRGAGDLGASTEFVTKVEAVADLVLAVADPKGPLPTGENIEYEIKITNRGTKSARGVNIVMHFSEGVEPVEAEGITNELGIGEVKFAPIAQIDPGQEITLKVKAAANKAGSHRFRAQLLCEEADSHEVAEGTTRFFGESTGSAPEKSTDTETSNDVPVDAGAFKR